VIVKLEILSAKRRLIKLEYLTIAWVLIEAFGGITSGIQSHAITLLGFGATSSLEFLSATIVLQRISPLLGSHATETSLEEVYSRISAVLLVLLALALTASAAWSLLEPHQVSFSTLGLAVTVASVPMMFWISNRKNMLNQSIGAGSIRADAVMSWSCGSTALVAAFCAATQLVSSLCWIDSIGSLVISTICAREAVSAWNGKRCGCTRAHDHI
jgi:hypothetical protein